MDDFTVRKGIWDADTKIAHVERKRHTVIFPEDNGEASGMTYCNNCGSPFIMSPKWIYKIYFHLPNKCAKCWEDQ